MMPLKNNGTFWALIIIALLIFAVFYNTLGNSIVFDDREFISIVAKEKGAGLAEILNTKMWQYFPGGVTSGSFYRPVFLLSIWLDYKLWKDWVTGYHLTNIALHFFGCAILYLLLRLILKNPLIAFISTALFAVHPIQTETVAWISGRNDMLLAIFIFLAFISYANRKTLFSYIAFIIALFTKESAFVFLLLFAFYDFILSTERRDETNSVSKNGLKATAIRYCGFLAILTAYFLIRIFVIKDMGSASIARPSLSLIRDVPLYYLSYLKIFFIGTAQYTFVPSVWLLKEADNATRLIYWLLTVAGFIAAYLLTKNFRILKFAIGWFVVAMLPYSGIIAMPWPLMEHRLYIPSIGIFIIIAYGLHHFIREAKSWRRTAGIVLFIALIASFAAVTHGKNRLFRSELSVFEETVKNNPAAAIARIGLASAYMNSGRQAEALFQLREAVKISDIYWEAHFFLGQLYALKSEYRTAIDEFRKALPLNPPDPNMIYGEMANAITLRGGNEKEDAAVYNVLGLKEGRARNIEKAIIFFNRGIECDPDSAEIYNNLGYAYYIKKDLPKAVEYFARALQADPDFKKARQNLEAVNKMLAPSKDQAVNKEENADSGQETKR